MVFNLSRWRGFAFGGVVAVLMLAGVAWPQAQAEAQGITRPVIQAGGWAMIEHLPAAESAPDSCMIVETDAAVALRSIGSAVDVMVANAHWDLPTRLHGAMQVATQNDHFAFPVTATTRNTAAALVDASTLPTLLDAMTQGTVIRVTLFPGMPVLVPMAGFTAALPAFRHCAGLS
jgi:hypothetical protein